MQEAQRFWRRKEVPGLAVNENSSLRSHKLFQLIFEIFQFSCTYHKVVLHSECQTLTHSVTRKRAFALRQNTCGGFVRHTTLAMPSSKLYTFHLGKRESLAF